jgi:hypothetical protein
VQVALTTGFDRQITGPLLAAVDWGVPGVLDAVVCADEVAAGRAARAGTVLGVLTGARTTAELAAAGPDRVVDGVADLPGLLGIAARSA